MEVCALIKVSTERFEQLVRDAIDSLPERFLDNLDNVIITVERWPTREQLDYHGLGPRETLLGLYEGVPVTERGSYSPAMPDRITIFQGPIEAYSTSESGLVQQVRDTVVHEVAHHFGIDDDRLHELNL